MGQSKKPENQDDPPPLSESEWRELSRFVHESVGIKLSEAKRVFLGSRLLKRLRATGARSYRDYLRLVLREPAQSGEHQELINAVTTNKTDFFREAEHFRVLERWLDSGVAPVVHARATGLKIWCAAASTGEEPYTIAAVLRERLTEAEFLRAQLVASDIDTQVLEVARRGVYGPQSVGGLDASVVSNMFVRGTGVYRDKFRVRRELREKVRFVQQNLLDPLWHVGERFDLVFCRNVLIYFDRATQQQVVTRLLRHTEMHGLLFLGHAESLTSLSVRAKTIAHAVYAPAQGLSRYPEMALSVAKASATRAHSITPRTASVRPRAPSHAPRHPTPAFIAQAEALHVGECRVDAPQWLTATLEQSLLVLLYSPEPRMVLVCHLAGTNHHSLGRQLRDGLASLQQLCGARSQALERLSAKIVATDESKARETASALADKSVTIRAMKQVHEAACLWIEPHTSRILLRKPSRAPRTLSP